MTGYGYKGTNVRDGVTVVSLEGKLADEEAVPEDDTDEFSVTGISAACACRSMRTNAASIKTS